MRRRNRYGGARPWWTYTGRYSKRADNIGHGTFAQGLPTRPHNPHRRYFYNVKGYAAPWIGSTYTSLDGGTVCIECEAKIA